MKQIILFAFVAMTMGGCDHSNKNTAAAGPAQDWFGEKFDLAAAALPVSQLSAKVMGADTLAAIIEGTITETCPNAGCWFNLKLDNGEEMKVTTDHVFFVPTEGCEGKKVKVAGKAFMTERSVETLQHYAEEEGKTAEEIAAITAPVSLLSFVATGAMIEGLVDTDLAEHDHSTCDHDHSAEGGHDHEHTHEGEEKH